MEQKFVELRERLRIANAKEEEAAAECRRITSELNLAIHDCEHVAELGVLPDSMTRALRGLFGQKFLKNWNQGPVCRKCGYAGEFGYYDHEGLWK